MMTPDIQSSLSVLAQVMGEEMAPNIGDEYLGALSALISGLLIMASQEHDRAADNLIRENAAIQSYLEKHRARFDSPELRRQITAVLDHRAPDFRISTLSAENQRLKQVFVAAHGYVEEQGADWARAADEEAWGIITASQRSAPVENVLDLFDSPG